MSTERNAGGYFDHTQYLFRQQHQIDPSIDDAKHITDNSKDFREKQKSAFIVIMKQNKTTIAQLNFDRYKPQNVMLDIMTSKGWDDDVLNKNQVKEWHNVLQTMPKEDLQNLRALAMHAYHATGSLPDFGDAHPFAKRVSQLASIFRHDVENELHGRK